MVVEVSKMTIKHNKKGAHNNSVDTHNIILLTIFYYSGGIEYSYLTGRHKIRLNHQLKPPHNYYQCSLLLVLHINIIQPHRATN